MKAILVAVVLAFAMPVFGQFESAPAAPPTAEKTAGDAPALQVKRWTERVDKKSGARVLTVWLKNEGMRDWKGPVALVIKGKGEREEQRSTAQAEVPVHGERGVEVQLSTLNSLGTSGGFTGLGADLATVTYPVKEVASIAVAVK